MIVNDGRYYLYRHVRLDTGQPFYIGIGTKPKKRIKTHEGEYSRAYAKGKSSRGDYWRRIVAKVGYEIEILMESDDYDFIKQKEIEFIALYGRENIGTGALCNLTDGGDGNIGRIISEETRKKSSDTHKLNENALRNLRERAENKIISAKEKYEGKEFKMKQGFFIKVLNYTNARKVLIEIIDTSEKRICGIAEVRKGSIKDYSPLTANGGGYLGKRGHNKNDIGRWRAFRNKCETTHGICDNWLNFEIFTEWYSKNKKEGFHLVTHLLGEEGLCNESNTYFMPFKLHMVLQPVIGYCQPPRGRIRANFRNKDYGAFDSIEEAFEKHKQVKKDYISSLVEEYKEDISKELYNKIKNHNIKVL